MGSHFGVGAPPILVYSGDWDVHWGYDLAFDPWPLHSTRAFSLWLTSHAGPLCPDSPAAAASRGVSATR